MNMGSECGCGCSGVDKVPATVEWTIPGIKCQGCADKLKVLLEGVKGIKLEGLNLETKTVTLKYNAARLSEAQVRDTLAQAGFAVAA
jgi:copper chaperone CopZ